MGNIDPFLNKAKQTLNFIPKAYNLEISNETTKINYKRIAYLSIILIIINFGTILFDLTIYRPNWSVNGAYINLFYAHLVLLVERMLYISFVYILYIKRLSYLFKLKKFLVLYSCMMIMAWCAYLSINAQAIHGQMSAFIICNFSLASVILLKPMESMELFLLNSILFILGIFMHSKDVMLLISNVINTAFVFSFAYILSYINIWMFTKNYINKLTIKSQAKALENSRDKLEETVKIRTKELILANEQLIKEMGIRHEVEMKSIKTRLMYEENALLLNQIKEYEELRNVFFANLSHELRTPVNVIFSAQQMMNLVVSRQECDECKTQVIKYNKIVKQNCYRLIRLIGNLIDITKIDAKYFEISMKNCDIVKLVESITLSVAEYIKDKNLKLCFDTDLAQKIIACDPDKVERIMLNLLSNAVKFTPEHGEINVSIKTATNYVVISVKDSGIGISKDMQKVIFERFIQADKSMTRRREGSGIGLSLVKSLVDLHQGRISIQSELGEGSNFIVELPDMSIESEEYIACTSDTMNSNIERINIEFSDIYS